MSSSLSSKSVVDVVSITKDRRSARTDPPSSLSSPEFSLVTEFDLERLLDLDLVDLSF